MSFLDASFEFSFSGFTLDASQMRLSPHPSYVLKLYQTAALMVKRGDKTTAEVYLDTVVLFMLQFAPMKIIRQTERYMKWFKRLKDLKAKARIAVRIRRMEQGDVGEV